MRKVDFGRTIENLQKMIAPGNLTGIQRETCADALLLLNGMLEQIEETKSCRLCAKDSKCDPNARSGTKALEVYYECNERRRKNLWIWKGVQK